MVPVSMSAFKSSASVFSKMPVLNGVIITASSWVIYSTIRMYASDRYLTTLYSLANAQ